MKWLVTFSNTTNDLGICGILLDAKYTMVVTKTLVDDLYENTDQYSILYNDEPSDSQLVIDYPLYGDYLSNCLVFNTITEELSCCGISYKELRLHQETYNLMSSIIGILNNTDINTAFNSAVIPFHDEVTSILSAYESSKLQLTDCTVVPVV
jgi:hypothetical protein